MLRLCPPARQEPEDWLSRYGKPTLCPQWPTSDRLALCVVYEENPGETAAAVLLRESEIDRAMEHQPALFYVVPRSIVLVESVCPGITPDLFHT